MNLREVLPCAIERNQRQAQLRGPLSTYCVEKLAFSRKLVNSDDLKALKLLFLLRHISAETPEIRRVRVFQHNRTEAEVGVVQF
jgi:hypothetical protein